MVKYLFVIFYLCVVMFLNLGHQLAKGETCGDSGRGNARYMNANKTEFDHQRISPDDVKIDFPLHGQSTIAHLRDNLRVFPRFPRPDPVVKGSSSVPPLT